MKKLLRTAALAAALLGASAGFAWVGNTNLVEAYAYCNDTYYEGCTDYPQYLNGDTNYELAYTHMGMVFYVDKSSVYLDSHQGKTYTIVGNVIQVRGSDGAVFEPRTSSYLIAWFDGRMGIYNSNLKRFQLFGENQYEYSKANFSKAFLFWQALKDKGEV